jgi:hypothetical protein
VVQVRNANGLRGVFKFSEILGSTLYSHIYLEVYELPLTQYFNFVNYMYLVLLWFAVLKDL